MDDMTLMNYLINHPSFENQIEVTDKAIIAYFSDRDAPVDQSFVDQLRDTQRHWDLTGKAIVFDRPGEITTKHILTVVPEKPKFFSWFNQLRFSIR